MGFQVSHNSVHFNARAKYIPQSDGSLKLVQVQHFTGNPRFAPDGWETSSKGRSEVDIEDVSEKTDTSEANIIRASRRAKIHAFDTILCNPSLDAFATFTYAPDESLEKSSYEQCYDVLKPWLSNRVQRNGLQYVIVPERHKSGDIHFHGIMNSAALKLDAAISPKTGRPLTKNGSPIYNLRDWRAGFSTVQIIGGGADDREKVAKYVFKYMGKQLGERIGGRYALIGGQDLAKPVYAYGDSIEEFLGAVAPKYSRSVAVGDGVVYSEVSLL